MGTKYRNTNQVTCQVQPAFLAELAIKYFIKVLPLLYIACILYICLCCTYVSLFTTQYEKTNFAHGHKMCSSDQSRERYTSFLQVAHKKDFKLYSQKVSQQSTVHIYTYIYIKTVRFQHLSIVCNLWNWFELIYAHYLQQKCAGAWVSMVLYLKKINEN